MPGGSFRIAFLTALLSIVGRAVAQSSVPLEISNASSALRSALVSEQISPAVAAARNLINTVQSEIQRNPSADPQSADAVRAPQPFSPALHLSDLCPLLSELDASVAAHELVRARRYALILAIAVNDSVPARPPTAPAALTNAEKNAFGRKGFARYLELGTLARAAFDAGDLARADTWSSELLAENEKYRNTGVWGQGVFYGNLIRGRLELARGNVAAAAEYLIAAGRSTGSAPLDTFGPNMALARDLLLREQTATVLEYLNLCSAFWKDDHGALAGWKAAIQSGQIPDFRANLLY